MANPLPYISDPATLDALAELEKRNPGKYNPRDPEVRASLANAGRYMGEQPDQGAMGAAKAFAQGAWQAGIENPARGIADLPLAVGRNLGMTERRIGPAEQSPEQEIHPIASNLGALGGTVGSIMLGGTALKALGAGRALPWLGRLEQAGNAAVAAESEAVPALLSGLQPAAIASRAVPAAMSGAAYGFVQPVESGGIEAHLQNAFETGKAFGIAGGLGAPAGLPRLAAATRGAVAANVAFPGQQIVPGPVPSFVQNALLGGLDAIHAPEGRWSKATGKEIAPQATLPQEVKIKGLLPAPRTMGENLADFVDKAQESGQSPHDNPAFVAAAEQGVNQRRAAQGLPTLDELRRQAPTEPTPVTERAAELAAPYEERQVLPEVGGASGAPKPEGAKGAVQRRGYGVGPEFKNTPFENLRDQLNAARWKNGKPLMDPAALHERVQAVVEDKVVRDGIPPAQAEAEAKGAPDAVAIAEARPTDSIAEFEDERPVVAPHTPKLEKRSVAANAEKPSAEDQMLNDMRQSLEGTYGGRELPEWLKDQPVQAPMAGRGHARRARRAPKGGSMTPEMEAASRDAIGKEGGSKWFPYWTPEQRMEHTATRLEAPEYANNTEARRNTLKRIVREPGGERGVSMPGYPISKAYVSERVSANGRRAAIEKARELGMRIEPSGRDWVVRNDRVADGYEEVASNVESALFRADRMLNDQMVADRSLPGSGVIDGSGPNAPQKEQLGIQRPDGTRITATQGEGNGTVPPTPLKLEIGRGNRWISPMLKTLDSINKFMAKNGKQSQFTKRMYEVLERRRQADEVTQRMIADFRKSVNDSGLKPDAKTREKWDMFATELDTRVEQRLHDELAKVGASIDDMNALLNNQVTPMKDVIEGANKAVADAAPQIAADLRAELKDKGVDISDKEFKFLLDRRTLDSVFALEGLDPAVRRSVYYPRFKKLMLESTDMGYRQRLLNMQTSVDGLSVLKPRSSPDMPSWDLAKAIEDYHYNEAFRGDRNRDYLDKIETMIRMVARRTVAGDSMQNLLDSMGTANVAGRDVLLIDGMLEPGRNLTDKLIEHLEGVLGVPSERSLAQQSAIKNNLRNWSERLQKATDIAHDWHAPKPVLDAMTRFYQKLGISANQDHVRSMLDSGLQVYRSSVMGLNLMFTVRNMVSDSMMSYIRFDTPTYARAIGNIMGMAVKDWKGLVNKLEDLRLAGVISPAAYPELGEANWVSKFSVMKAAEKMNFLFKYGDLYGKLVTAEASELATRNAFPKFQKEMKSLGAQAAWENFMERTGLDLASDAFTPVVKERAIAALRDGKIHDLVTAVQNTNISQANIWFERYNAPAFMQFAPGRLFGLFGSWPIHMAHSMWDAASGPFRHYGNSGRAYRRVAAIGAKYALAGEAIYSLGAAMNIDTSDWIPFASSLIFTGSPQWTSLEKARDLVSGDPVEVAAFESDPLRYSMLIARRSLGFPGQSLVRGALSQTGMVDDELTRKMLGMRDQEDSLLGKMRVIGGFFPWEDDGSGPRRQNLIRRLEAYTFGNVQDLASQATGGMLAAGTQEGM